MNSFQGDVVPFVHDASFDGIAGGEEVDGPYPQCLLHMQHAMSTWIPCKTICLALDFMCVWI